MLLWQHHPATLSLYAEIISWSAWSDCYGDCYQGIELPSQSNSIPLSLLQSDDITPSMPCTLSWVVKGAWGRQQKTSKDVSEEMKGENNFIIHLKPGPTQEHHDERNSETNYQWLVIELNAYVTAMLTC